MNLFKRLFCKNKENGFKYVDLGLTSGTMWATCNVGASRSEDSGLLFQFGRVDGYKYGDSNKFRTNNQNKQDTDNEYIPITSSGKTYDKNEILDLADDAAHVRMGGKWRMPTYDELKELFNNTTWELETINEVQGMMFISNINNKRLFVPFAGYWYNGNFSAAGSYANVWSSQVHHSNVLCAYRLSCHLSGNASIYGNSRPFAFSVRGVFKK